MDWLEFAKRIPCGQSRRSKHCGSDTSMLVSHGERGYSCHCFRCGTSEFQPHGYRSASDILRHRAEAKVKYAKVLKLPDDFSQELPTHAVQWIAKAGISPERAVEDGIGYSHSLDRLVMPVWSLQGLLVACQYRSLRPHVKPKYINPYGSNSKNALYWGNMGVPKGDTVVIVEDRLSAMKIDPIMDSVALLGKDMSNGKALAVSHRYSKAVIWLDPDKAGETARAQVDKQLQLMGMTTYHVRSERDPKYYIKENITKYLQEYL